jgi:hypothetical protein
VGEPAQGPDLIEGGPEAAARPRRRFRGALPLLLLSLVILMLLGLGLTALTLLRVATPLREGRDALQQGRSALIRGDAAAAGDAFDTAGAAFRRARGATEGLPGRISRAVPIVGGNARVADALALAGDDAAEAGGHLVDAVSGLPGGFDALAPRHGRIPLRALARVTPDVAAAAGLIQGGLFDLQRSPAGLLLSPVATAREQALETFGTASGTLGSAAALLEVLPGLAGAHEPTHYFFGAQTPAELRGTGGLIGAFATVTLDEGRFSISPFQPVQVLHDLPPDRLPPPNPDFRANYDQFGGAGDWSNINMTPDFPSAARAITSLYERNTGRSIDGVMVADPVALQSLLRVTGPAEVRGLGTTIDAKNVVSFTEERAYSLFRTALERKVVLGAAASGVLTRFLAMDGKGVERVQALAHAASGGHLLVYAGNPQVERGLQAAGVADGLAGPAGGGDALSVIVNSASGSKIDYWSTRSVSYRVKLQPGGDATAFTDVTLRNGGPTHGEPRYVIGPFPGLGLRPGDARSLVSIYCAPGCRGFGPTRDGRPVKVRLGSELGFRWYQDFPTLPSGASSTFHLGTLVPGVWQGNDRGGTYSLMFLDQAATHPTSLHIEVTAPPGMHITSTSLPMQVEGNTATWEGVPTFRMQLQVAFAPSLPVRAWRTLTGWIP